MATKSAITKRKVGEKVLVVIPRSRDEATEFVRQVGDVQRQLERIAADAEGRIAAIKQEVAEKAQPHQEKIDQLVQGLYEFFEANCDELTGSGKRKSVDLATGTIGKYTNPHKVDLTERVVVVLANLHALKLHQFIRSKEEIDREEMLKTEESRKLAATVKGVKIAQTVEFRVKPNETLEEIIADEARLKRGIA